MNFSKRDVTKPKDIINWRVPTNVTQIRQLLGLANYYHRYIQHFADISVLLNALTQKYVQFQWTNECADAFTTYNEKSLSQSSNFSISSVWSHLY